MLGGADLRHPSLRGPSGLLEEILLIEVAGLKPSGGVLYSVQPMLPEASGQVGVVPAAVSWEWLPGAPRVGAHDAWAVHGENSSCGRMGTARFCGRVAGAFGRLRDLLPAGHIS